MGGYEPGYQGGSEGISVRTTGPLYNEDRGYARDFHERGYRRPGGVRREENRGVPMRGGARDLDPAFGRGEHGDAFVYRYGRAAARFGGSGQGRSGGYGRDFRGGYGREYDRGIRGYAREFQ